MEKVLGIGGVFLRARDPVAAGALVFLLSAFVQLERSARQVVLAEVLEADFGNRRSLFR